MGAGVFIPGRVAGSSGMVEGDEIQAPQELSAEDKTKADNGLSELKPSGAETTRLDTGGDTELT